MKGTSRLKRLGGSVAALFLGMLCLGGGVWAGHITVVAPLSLWYEARDWETVEATVSKVHLARVGKERKYAYRVEARHRYRWEGRELSGHRVGVSLEFDNVGSWQHETYQKLLRSYEEKLPVVAFIDPAHPDRSLLDRSLRGGLVLIQLAFVSVFIMIGGALLLTVLY